MATPKLKKLKTANLYVEYLVRANQFPYINSVHFKGQNVNPMLRSLVFSTIVGTKRYAPYGESVHIDPALKDLMFKYFSDIINLKKGKQDVAVACTNFFFERICLLYWNLIINSGSKNLAIAFLSEICTIIELWEKKRKKQIHKGTLYYFLTFSFLQVGDIDSAFATMFKAIEEDKRSFDPLFGKEAHKDFPAYKYASLVEDEKNYLYKSIIELRKLIKQYVRAFNLKSQLRPRFSIAELDTKFLQNNDKEIEQIKFLFTYCVEKHQKYVLGMPALPINDFYKIRNANFFFALCLIADKILQKRYENLFKSYLRGAGRRRGMSMGDGVALLFEDMGWIGPLTTTQRGDPRGCLSISPSLPKNKPKEWIKKFFKNPIQLRCCGRNLDYKMKVMLFTLKLRNYAGHNIKKQDIFVENYLQIVNWVLSAIFIAVRVLPKPKKTKKKQALKLSRAVIPELTWYSVETVSTTANQEPLTTLPPPGTIHPSHYQNTRSRKIV